MHLISVNIGKPERISLGTRETTTGIRKQPADGPVEIGRLGIADDAVMDTAVHGGPDQAVYVFGGADYDWWSAELGETLAPGTFGENLTIAGLESADCAIGDRLAIGDKLVLEVTAPRIPCAVLAHRMRDPQFIKRYRDAERPGLYVRVIAEGTAQAGDAVTVTPVTGERVTARELFRDNYAKEHAAEDLRRFLSVPLAERMRAAKQELLDRLTSAG